MLIHISGTGKLADAIHAVCRSGQFEHFQSDVPLHVVPGLIVIHVGSRDRFKQTLKFCEKHCVPLILASTGHDDLVPKKPRCPIILAPNCALPMILLLDLVLPQMEAMRAFGMSVSLAETHQASKKDVPSGTALAIAHKLKLARESIVARRIGIRPCALHVLRFCGMDIEITLSTKTTSMRPYAIGAMKIAHALSNLVPIKRGIYPVREILQL